MILHDRLAELPILDAEGRPRPLRDLWASRGALVIFVRHFGCIFCRQQIAELRDAIPEVRRLGLEGVVIGNGTPNFIRGFQEALDMEGLAIYTDPTLATYAAAGLERGHLAALDLRWAASGLKALAAGHRQIEKQGDAFQLGGVLVFAKGGRLVFHQASRFAGDHATPEQILEAARTATQASSEQPAAPP